MAVNKSFVVKNGIEVATDLIYGTSDLKKVGIGSTIPGDTLDVRGGIAVTDQCHRLYQCSWSSYF